MYPIPFSQESQSFLRKSVKLLMSSHAVAVVQKLKSWKTVSSAVILHVQLTWATRDHIRWIILLDKDLVTRFVSFVIANFYIVMRCSKWWPEWSYLTHKQDFTSQNLRLLNKTLTALVRRLQSKRSSERNKLSFGLWTNKIFYKHEMSVMKILFKLKRRRLKSNIISIRFAQKYSSSTLTTRW